MSMTESIIVAVVMSSSSYSFKQKYLQSVWTMEKINNMMRHRQFMMNLKWFFTDSWCLNWFQNTKTMIHVW